MVNSPFATGHYYHVYNRGVEKRSIFLGKKDYGRFLETINFYRYTPVPMKLSDFRRGAIRLKKPEEQKEIVRIFSYCLMPNHYHLLMQQLVEGGATEFLRRLSDSYTRYFNTKYDRVGPLFQGSFKAKHVGTDEYLLQLSKYIHRNPFLLDKWGDKSYPYSSYSFYLSGEKHNFCDTSFILSYFSKVNPKWDYKAFVEESDVDDPSIYSLLLDEED